MRRASSSPLPQLLLLLLSLALFACAHAQPNLIVNGRVVSSNNTTLVPGSSYAQGAAVAQALGASISVDHSRGLALLQSGGRVMQILIAEEAAAALVGDAIWLDGRVVEGSAAVYSEGELYLPVKPVAEALGASVTFLPEENAVMVVQPRGRLTRMGVGEGRGERIELSVSAPVRFTSFFNEPLSTLHVYFERTDIEVRLPPAEGTYFTFASASASGGSAEVRIQLQEGIDYDLYAVPEGRGFRLNVLLSPQGVKRSSGHVVLDAGHGGDDLGFSSPAFGAEATLTLDFVTRLANALTERGITATLTRDSDLNVPVAERSRLGVGADLFVSFHVAELALGEFRAYYLEDAQSVEGLNMAIRENAAGALRGGGAEPTDAFRRQLLLGLVPDLDVGRRGAEAIAGRLFQLAGYRAASVAGAPLQVLGGAAGRGILLEFSAADLAASGLPERMAEAIDQLLSEGALGP